jgi:hypothetical protein
MSENNIPPNTELLEKAVSQLPMRKLTSFGIVETTPKEREIFKRLDALITKMFGASCPIISHHRKECEICDLLAIQREIQEMI